MQNKEKYTLQKDMRHTYIQKKDIYKEKTYKRKIPIYIRKRKIHIKGYIYKETYHYNTFCNASDENRKAESQRC